VHIGCVDNHAATPSIKSVDSASTQRNHKTALTTQKDTWLMHGLWPLN
jgi:ribonuclease I